ncbi:hypothetical protein [Desulfosarcina sp.]
MACSTSTDNPLIDLRMSVLPTAKKKTLLEWSGNIICPPPVFGGPRDGP